MTCISCGSYDVDDLRDEHGHWVRECNECGHEWGPFVSPGELRRRGEGHLYPELCGKGREDGQAGLEDF